VDFPGAEIIADRLAASNPLAQIDEKSDVPPQVQMQLAQAQQMIQQLQQEKQMLAMDIKYGATMQQAKEDAHTKRTLMETTARAYNTQTMAEVKVNDQNTRSITSQNKTEIDAIVKLLIANLDTRQLEAEIERRNDEQFAYAKEAASDIAHESNPLTGAPQTNIPMPQRDMALEPIQPQPMQQPMQPQQPMPQGVQ